MIEELKPLRGAKLDLMTLVGDPETPKFAQQLLSALRAAGLAVLPASGMMMNTPSGLYFTAGVNRLAEANAIGAALRKAGIASDKIPVETEQRDLDSLVLVVAPKH